MAVYIITDGTKYKIGYSDGSPEKRLRALQTGNPNKLRLVAILSNASIDVEDNLKRKFAHKRCTGGEEWFSLDESDIDTILKEINHESADFGYYRESYNPEWVYTDHVRPLCGGYENSIASRSEDVLHARWEDFVPTIGQHHVIPVCKEHDLDSEDHRRKIMEPYL